MSYSVASCQMPEFLPAGRRERKIWGQSSRCFKMELLFQHSESLQKRNRCHSFLFLQPPTPNYAQRHLKSAYCAYSQQIKPTRRQQQDQSLFTLLVYRPASIWCSQGIRILRDPKFLFLQTISHNFFLSLGWQSGVPTSSPTKP